MKKYLLFLLIFCHSIISTAQDSLNITALYHWYIDTIPNSNYPAYGGALDNKFNEVWGYVRNSREYAFIGSTLGTHIFDVTDAVNSEEILFVPGRVSDSLVVHRDFHDYKDYLYIVADEGNSSLQILDLRFLPDSAPVVYDSDSIIKTSHNIFIDRQAGLLYTCGGRALRHNTLFPSVTGNDFSVISLEDPTNPKMLINCKYDLPFWNTIGYVHDVYVEDSIAYCHAGTEGFFIVDFSDTSNVQLIGSLTQYIQQGYNHSGWLHQNGTIYAMADETWGMDIKILDVSDFNNIEVIDTIGSNVNNSLSIVHNLIFREDYLFVSHFVDGLYIFDLSDINDIKLAGFYDTSTEPHAFEKWQGAWGVYPFLSSSKVLISDMENGLWVLDASNAIVLGNNEKEKLTPIISIFPNPVDDVIFIKGTQGEKIEYSIKALNGKVIEKGVVYTPYININNNLSQGAYLLEINNNNNFSRHIFIKNN